MRVALLIVSATALLGLVLGSLLRRFGSQLGFWISFVARTLLRLTVAVLLAATAVAAAEKGRVLFIAIAVVLAAVAACSFALSGILIWGVKKFGAPTDV